MKAGVGARVSGRGTGGGRTAELAAGQQDMLHLLLPARLPETGAAGLECERVGALGCTASAPPAPQHRADKTRTRRNTEETDKTEEKDRKPAKRSCAP